MVSKIALVDVGTWKPGFYGGLSSLDPLGIEYLGGTLVKYDYNVKLFQKRGSLEELINELEKENADIVGISSPTCDIYDAFKIADIVKKNDKVKTIVGGYHATALPNEILKNNSVDFAVLGEGENVLLELIKSLYGGKTNFDSIPNLGWKTGDGDIKINKRDFSQLPDLSIWPLRKKEFFDGNKIYGVVYPPISSHKSAMITYSRNCPYNCKFCCSPWLFGNKVRWRDPKDVVNEMDYLRNNFDVDLFFFSDLTFNSNRRKVEELCNLLKNKDLSWYAMCSVDSKNIDEELISLMKEAGMTRILFGLESFSENVLKEYGRVIKKNRVKYFNDLLRILDKYGIGARCTYMLGEINETEEDLRTYLKLFKQILPDEMSPKILTPFPGTPLFDEYKNKGLLLHEQWDKYNIKNLVFKHPSLSEGIFKKYQYEITKQYYESNEYKNHVREKIKNHPYLKQSFIDYFKRLKTKGVNVNFN